MPLELDTAECENPQHLSAGAVCNGTCPARQHAHHRVRDDDDRRVARSRARELDQRLHVVRRAALLEPVAREPPVVRRAPQVDTLLVAHILERFDQRLVRAGEVRLGGVQGSDAGEAAKVVGPDRDAFLVVVAAGGTGASAVGAAWLAQPGAAGRMSMVLEFAPIETDPCMRETCSH
jgi:hypothetical protein